MRSLRLAEMISVMHTSGPRVTIEFDAGASEHMAGWLLDEDGTAAPFNGWLGLAGILGPLLAPAAGSEAAAPGRDEAPG